jgi:hypothetical protein
MIWSMETMETEMEAEAETETETEVQTPGTYHTDTTQALPDARCPVNPEHSDER